MARRFSIWAIRRGRCFIVLDFDESDHYLRDRAAKGYTVIQAVALSEHGGLAVPNRNGDLPLENNDPTKPNEKYFAHVDRVVNRAQELGLVIGFLPTWGAYWNPEMGQRPGDFYARKRARLGRIFRKALQRQAGYLDCRRRPPD